MSTEVFITQSLLFEKASSYINNEQIPTPIINATFGVLQLQAISSPICPEIHEFIFMIDCSASMSEDCADGTSKMRQIIHTLKNMILYFKENTNIQHYITINCFNEKIYNTIERCTITKDNFNEIIEKIDNIMPRASTNIELALQSIKKNVAEIKQAYPQHNICNIFMTDGEATVGNCEHEILAKLVDQSITNAFIGFGIQHDEVLLNTISNGQNYFIDKLENSGYVYGEILHDIIYKLLKNVEINVNNGLIYDFKNNVWVETLIIGEIASEANKIYHICSNNHAECVVNITADGSSSLHIMSQHTEENLIKYIYRQRTLQHLFIVKDFLKIKKDNVAAALKDGTYKHFNPEIDKQQLEIKTSLVKFIEEMKLYMSENNLCEDKIMKNLCDDIYICHRTFGTKFGNMYVSARQTSQGSQRGYNVNHPPEVEVEDDNNNINNIFMPLTQNFHRHRMRMNLVKNDDISPLLLTHNLSNITEAPYLTPSSIKIMQELSK